MHDQRFSLITTKKNLSMITKNEAPHWQAVGYRERNCDGAELFFTQKRFDAFTSLAIPLCSKL